MSLKPCLLSKEMDSFFTDRGYSFSSLENDLQRVATINHHDALRPSEQRYTTVDRVPLVLNIQRFLLQNFRILSTDEQTRCVFPQPPFVAYKRDHVGPFNVSPFYRAAWFRRESAPSKQPLRSHKFRLEIRGLESSFTIRDHFTCQSENLVYCISCALLHIGETGRNLRSCFSEHLRSIRAYAQQHSLVSRGPTFQLYWPQYFSDVQVRGVALCNGNPGFTISQGESKIISLNKEYRCKRTHDLTILTAKQLKIS